MLYVLRGLGVLCESIHRNKGQESEGEALGCFCKLAGGSSPSGESTGVLEDELTGLGLNVAGEEKEEFRATSKVS